MIDGVLVIYSNPEEGGTGDSGEGYMVNGRGGLYPVGLITRLKEAFQIKLHSSADRSP